MIELTGEVDLCHECEHGIGMEVVSIGGKCLVCAMEHAKLDSCEIVVTLACGGDVRAGVRARRVRDALPEVPQSRHPRGPRARFVEPR